MAISTLRRLDITRWAISDDFIRTVSRLPYLEELDLGACARLTALSCLYLKQNAERLRRLNFRCSMSLEDNGIAALEDSASLETLDLTLARNISDDGILPLGNSDCFPKLTTVLLSQCRLLTDVAVKALAQNTGLRYIDLSYCGLLTDAAAFAVSKLPFVEELDFSGCRNMTDDGVRVTAGLRRLQRLRLANCGGLTDRAAEFLYHAANAPLQHIEARKCSGITAEGIKKLKLSCQVLIC